MLSCWCCNQFWGALFKNPCVFHYTTWLHYFRCSVPLKSSVFIIRLITLRNSCRVPGWDKGFTALYWTGGFFYDFWLAYINAVFFRRTKECSVASIIYHVLGWLSGIPFLSSKVAVTFWLNSQLLCGKNWQKIKNFGEACAKILEKWYIYEKASIFNKNADFEA